MATAGREDAGTVLAAIPEKTSERESMAKAHTLL